MNILIILGHPDTNSFNHAIASTARDAVIEKGHTVTFHDLYAEKFDPNLPKEEIPQDAELPALITQHCEELSIADGIVVVHPNWWGQPPAILKGWIDRVVRPGVAYRFDEGDSGEGVPIGLLKAKAALVLNTSNTPDEREKTAFGDPLELLWKQCVFELCGIKNVKRKMFNVIVTSSIEQRQQWLGEVKALAQDMFKIEANIGLGA
jgi:putative NADPH-quinone reductase